jgi:alpha-glucoside transport system permease protein
VLSKVLDTLVTVVIGVAAAVILFFVLNFLAERLKGKWEDRIKPYLFLLPALLVVAVYLVYPTLQTIFYAFANADSTKIVGLKNFDDLLVKNVDDFHQTLLNTLLWIIVAPALTIGLGLVVAVLSDKLRSGGEKLSKTLIFMPMAIGGVGTATIWKFVYDAEPSNQTQIGLQNAIWTHLGGSPIAWLQHQSFHINSLELIIMFLWGQIGFSMVLLSAAIKGVPADTLEAARIDGANEIQIFFRVVVPQIRVTIVTVFITVLIGTLKIFDIIYVTTNGGFNTNVIGVEFFNQESTNQNAGYAAAIVVILLVAVAPIMWFQVRQFKAQEAAR